MQSGFGGVVDGAPDVGDVAGYGADLDDGAVGVAQEGKEGLAETDDGEEVRGEYGLHFLEVGFDGWDAVIYEFMNYAL